MTRIIIRGVNPEPWAVGTVNCFGKGRRGTISPNPKVVNYQRALQDELERANLTQPILSGWPLDVRFWYARSTKHGQPADITNLNKATEDALQGYLFGNDRNNRRVTGEFLEQNSHVEHVGVIIEIEEYEYDPDEHDQMLAELVLKPIRAFSDSEYVPPEEDPFE